MRAINSSMLAIFVSLPLSLAQTKTETQQYTVWASAMFLRNGETTPKMLYPQTLTSLGAQQAFAAGSLFRERYVEAGLFSATPEAPIDGLTAELLSPADLYVLALDSQPSIASAQAFLQGLYPPSLPGNNTGGSAVAGALDSNSLLANGTYISTPLGGYQYVRISTANTYDPEYVYVSGQIACPAWQAAAYNSFYSQSTIATRSNSQPLYRSLQPLLSSILPDPESWDYLNALDIYDYLAFQNTHNSTVAALLNSSTYTSTETNTTALDRLRWLADQQQRSYYANLTTVANATPSDSLPDTTAGSISTLPGNTLAAKLLSQLQTSLYLQSEVYKLAVLVADFEPLLSLFALMGLPSINTDFNGLPNPASSLVVEVFSMENNSVSPAFPDMDDLWVQVFFRNGTEDDYQSFPVFSRGPSETEMPWNVFESLMAGISLDGRGEWCTVCGAQSYFCPYFVEASNPNENEPTTLVDGKSEGGLSRVVAGVIGAIVALAIAGLLFAAVMLLAGVRFVRRNKGEKYQKRDLGGFKGSAKLASDQDLSLPSKGGVAVGASVERSVEDAKGHERVGSWEMKGHRQDDGDERSIIGENSFVDPVRPDERV